MPRLGRLQRIMGRMVVPEAEDGHAQETEGPAANRRTRRSGLMPVRSFFSSASEEAGPLRVRSTRKDLRPEKDQGPPTFPFLDLDLEPALRSIFLWI